MIVLITGSRDWKDVEAIRSALARLPARAELVIGDARGADAIALQVARELGLHGKVYKAHWQAEGKQAGVRRNERMLREGRPDLVLAFPLPQSRGTKHMIAIAREAGVQVVVHGERKAEKPDIARCIRCTENRAGICYSCKRRKAKGQVNIEPRPVTWKSCKDCGAPLNPEGECSRCPRRVRVAEPRADPHQSRKPGNGMPARAA